MNAFRRLRARRLIAATSVLCFAAAGDAKREKAGTALPDSPQRLTRTDPPAAPGSMGVNLLLSGAGILLSWLEAPKPDAKPQEGNYALRYARFANGAWSPPRTIVSGSGFFANWADFPSMVQARKGWLLAHWAEKSGEGTYAYDVELARAEKLDGPWRRLGPAHDDRTETEHGFVSFVPEGEAIRAFWLDGREMQMEEDSTEGHGGGNMTLRTALIGEKAGGAEVLDARVCECCQTSAAVTSMGPVIVYRDRSEKEMRDIAIVRRMGKSWSRPRAVAWDGWEITGCPVNGPAIAADGRRVAVAWFTAAQDRPRVQVAFSKNAGATFSKPIVVDDSSPLGRVDVALDAQGDALVCWAATLPKPASIRLRRVSAAGRRGEPIVVAETTAARASGFPRLERSGETLLVACVESGEVLRLRAAAVAASAVPPAAASRFEGTR